MRGIGACSHKKQDACFTHYSLPCILYGTHLTYIAVLLCHMHSDLQCFQVKAELRRQLQAAQATAQQLKQQVEELQQAQHLKQVSDSASSSLTLLLADTVTASALHTTTHPISDLELQHCFLAAMFTSLPGLHRSICCTAYYTDFF